MLYQNQCSNCAITQMLHNYPMFVHLLGCHVTFLVSTLRVLKTFSLVVAGQVCKNLLYYHKIMSTPALVLLKINPDPLWNSKIFLGIFFANIWFQITGKGLVLPQALVIISRWALAREGDYEMMPLFACVRVCLHVCVH